MRTFRTPPEPLMTSPVFWMACDFVDDPLHVVRFHSGIFSVG
jgi:hypothetical protein